MQTLYNVLCEMRDAYMGAGGSGQVSLWRDAVAMASLLYSWYQVDTLDATE
jgi:hypothetical protein